MIYLKRHRNKILVALLGLILLFLMLPADKGNPAPFAPGANAWEWSDIPGDFGDLNDVTITSVAAKNFLIRNAGNDTWINATPAVAIPAGTGLTWSGNTLHFKSNQVGTTTWFSGGSASFVWTFDVSGTDPVLTFGNNEFDFGAATLDAGAGNITLPTGTDVSGVTAEGQISWDSDDDKLYIGDGSAVVEIGAGGGGGNVTVAFKTFQVDGTDAVADNAIDTLILSAGEGIDVDGTNPDTITIKGEDASTTNKGIMIGHSDNFAFASGNMTIKTGGVNSDEILDDTIVKADFADEDWGMASIGSNSITIEDFALDTAADAGDQTIASIAKLEGLDAQIYIDLGNNGYIDLEADTQIRITAPTDLGDEDITSLDKLEFFDAAIYIDGGTDGQLDIEGDVINILGPTDFAANAVDFDSNTVTMSTVAGAIDAGSATSLEIPNGNNPTTDATGEIAWDANDNAIEVYDGSNSRLIPTLRFFSATIYDPDTIQGTEDAVPIFPVEVEAFPFGITLVDVGIKTDASSSYTVNFEEWTSPTDGSPSTIESVATSSSTEAEDDGTLSDASIAAGSIIYVDLPSTGIDMLVIWGTFWIIPGN